METMKHTVRKMIRKDLEHKMKIPMGQLIKMMNEAIRQTNMTIRLKSQAKDFTLIN